MMRRTRIIATRVMPMRRSWKKLHPMADEAQEKMDDEKEFAITRIMADTTIKGGDAGASQQ